ncbi:hypothetical protein GCM10020001_106310 [Nonomuraea salmonea]
MRGLSASAGRERHARNGGTRSDEPGRRSGYAGRSVAEMPAFRGSARHQLISLLPEIPSLQIWDCFPDRSYVLWRINQSWELRF